MPVAAPILCAVLAAFQVVSGTAGERLGRELASGGSAFSWRSSPGSRTRQAPERTWESATLTANSWWAVSSGRFISPDTAGPDLANPATFNRYAYVLNNPYRYVDPTGKDAVDVIQGIGRGVIDGLAVPTAPLEYGNQDYANGRAFGMKMGAALDIALGGAIAGGGIITGPGEVVVAPAGAAVAAKGAVSWVTADKVKADPNILAESRGGPPRDAQGNYLPDADAQGPHTTLGTRTSSKTGDPYTQGATFDKNGKFVGRTDVTSHGRGDHPNPHYHPAKGPASVVSGPHPLPTSE